MYSVHSDEAMENSHKYICRGTDDFKQTDESKSKHKAAVED